MPQVSQGWHNQVGLGEWDNTTNKCRLKQPSLYPVKHLNAEEVRAALCQKVEEADLNKQLLDLLLHYEDRFVFGLEKPGQSTTKHSIKLLGNPLPIKAKPRRVIIVEASNLLLNLLPQRTSSPLFGLLLG